MERISQSTLANVFENFDITLVALERLAHIAARAHQQSVEVSLYNDQSSIWVYGNPLLIGEVLDNLFGYALRYGCADRGGNIITNLV